MHANGYADDFKYGGGVLQFISEINKVVRVKDFDEKEKGKSIEKEFQDVKHWPDKTLFTRLDFKIGSRSTVALTK